VLGILVTIGLAFGFGVGGPVWLRSLVGFGAFAFSALLIRWPATRKRLMAFMHWLTER
jgi:hypothetical protein